MVIPSYKRFGGLRSLRAPRNTKKRKEPMQRPTITITLPKSKSVVTIYEFLTTKENRDIQKRVLASMKVTFDAASEAKIQDLSADATFELQELALSYLIVSIVDAEGVTAPDVKAYVDELPASDGDILYAKLNEVTTKSSLDAEGKKK